MMSFVAAVLAQSLNPGVPTLRLPDGGVRIAAHVDEETQRRIKAARKAGA